MIASRGATGPNSPAALRESVRRSTGLSRPEEMSVSDSEVGPSIASLEAYGDLALLEELIVWGSNIQANNMRALSGGITPKLRRLEIRSPHSRSEGFREGFHDELLAQLAESGLQLTTLRLTGISAQASVWEEFSRSQLIAGLSALAVGSSTVPISFFDELSNLELIRTLVVAGVRTSDWILPRLSGSALARGVEKISIYQSISPGAHGTQFSNLHDAAFPSLVCFNVQHVLTKELLAWLQTANPFPSLKMLMFSGVDQKGTGRFTTDDDYFGGSTPWELTEPAFNVPSSIRGATLSTFCHSGEPDECLTWL
jgi:hypothetical protein